MKILDGKVVADHRRSQIKDRVDAFKKARGRAPGLAVILVGDDPASQVYVGAKIKACAATGIESTEHRRPATISPSELKATIQALNADPKVDGILLQLPLPKHLSSDDAINWIDPSKDADCLTAQNLGRLWSGRPLTKPCTPWGVMVILQHYKIKTEGKHAVVVGRSAIVGKPMAHLLVEGNATVTICHSKTKNLKDFTKKADIVVVAAGKPEMLSATDFNKKTVVIDVGIHRGKPGKDGKSKLCGDVKFKTLKGKVAAATPVPGGVGPMTITMLLENTLILAESH